MEGPQMTSTSTTAHSAAPAPTDPTIHVQDWAELHVDDHVFRLVKPWRLEQLASDLEEAMRNRKVVRVNAYTELNGETVVLVNPAAARVVYLAKRPEIVIQGGMPDPA
jgi:hypothetical protein